MHSKYSFLFSTYTHFTYTRRKIVITHKMIDQLRVFAMDVLFSPHIIDKQTNLIQPYIGYVFTICRVDATPHVYHRLDLTKVIMLIGDAISICRMASFALYLNNSVKNNSKSILAYMRRYIIKPINKYFGRIYLQEGLVFCCFFSL